MSTAGLPSLLPIRTSVAVPSVSGVQSWYAKNVPGLSFELDAGETECSILTTNIGAYTEPEYAIEVRYVENANAVVGEHTVNDFVTYVGEVNANNTGPDWGWSAWYDRHLGVMFDSCPLDDYMRVFEKEDVSFHPHGRDGTTEDTDTARDHCWTEGVQGYGLEMQGNFSYTYKKSYAVFDWCTWDTEPKKHCCCSQDKCYQTCVADHNNSEVAATVCKMPHEMLNTSVCSLADRR